MRPLESAVFALALVAAAHAQSFPLESLVVKGTAIPRETILSITSLRLGAPVDKSAMDAACGKLRDTGLFETIAYNYAPGPRKGYILTLNLEDQKELHDAVIDFPGADEAALWKWLAAQYPPFNRRVPGNAAAQDYIAALLAEQAKAVLDGQPVVANMGTDLKLRKNLVSFQPASLPHIAALHFTGQHEFTAEELTAILRKMIAERGYTDRSFREIVQLNLGSAYEDHGMYRVQFPSITPQKTGTGEVSVTTSIEEGPRYVLGSVEFTGDHLPMDALKAIHFDNGHTADWSAIQQAIWDSERPVKRTGYFAASAHAERIFHDDRLVLDVKISYTLGPLYHAGQLRINGLIPSQEAQARKLWKMQPGDPYDFLYASEFLRAFLQTVDPRQFKKFDAPTQQQPGNIVDTTLVFEAK